MENLKELLPLAGELTVISCLVIIIYFLCKEIQRLRDLLTKQDEEHQAVLKEKDEQLSDAIDNHIKDLKESYKDIHSFTEKFNTLADKFHSSAAKLATELRSIIKN